MMYGTLVPVHMTTTLRNSPMTPYYDACCSISLHNIKQFLVNIFTTCQTSGHAVFSNEIKPEVKQDLLVVSSPLTKKF